MRIINYISNLAIPIVILIIILFGVKEKKKVYDIFVEGAKEGIGVVFNIFPTLLGLFIAIGALRSSGIIDLIIKLLKPITNIISFPSEVVPLAVLRPISGSASMSVAIDLMKTYGVDSKIGLISATIMGATETTLYTIAVYTSAVKIKKIRFVLISALLADIAGILSAVVLWGIMS